MKLYADNLYLYQKRNLLSVSAFLFKIFQNRYRTFLNDWFWKLYALILFMMGWGRGQKAPPPTSFSPVTSRNVRISPHLLTFSCNSFASLMLNFNTIPSASPKLLNLNQKHSSKKWFFWSNRYKMQVMITFFIGMLELPNFGHMTTSTI